MEKCPKCESSKISVEYYHQGKELKKNVKESITGIVKFIRNDSYYNFEKVTKECLVYTCKCGYQEATETKDNQ